MSDKPRNKDLVDDDRWKKKGGPHSCVIPIPSICPKCYGIGTLGRESTPDGYVPIECTNCQGTGEVWE